MIDIKLRGHRVERMEVSGTLDYITSELVYAVGLVYGALQASDPKKADLFKHLIGTVFGSNAKEMIFDDSICKFIEAEELPVEVTITGESQ